VKEAGFGIAEAADPIRPVVWLLVQFETYSCACIDAKAQTGDEDGVES
jgi:hypothetical protein